MESFSINSPCRVRVKLFRPTERSFSDTYDRDHQYVLLSDRIEPMGSHIKEKRSELVNWPYEASISIDLEKSYQVYVNFASTLVNLISLIVGLLI